MLGAIRRHWQTGLAALSCFGAGYATWTIVYLEPPAPAPSIQVTQPPRDSGVAVDLESAEELGRFRLSYYWIHQLDEEDHGPLPVFDRSCSVLTRVTGKARRQMRLEGTARLADGSIVNIAGDCKCGRFPCFQKLDGDRPFGLGVGGHSLEPFRSIAVDPRFIPIGTPVYVAELDGMRIPGSAPHGGYVHDGCVLASDRGNGIRGNKMDFFVAEREHYEVLRDLDLRRVHAYGKVDRCLNSRAMARSRPSQQAYASSVPKLDELVRPAHQALAATR